HHGSTSYEARQHVGMRPRELRHPRGELPAIGRPGDVEPRSDQRFSVLPTLAVLRCDSTEQQHVKLLGTNWCRRVIGRAPLIEIPGFDAKIVERGEQRFFL